MRFARAAHILMLLAVAWGAPSAAGSSFETFASLYSQVTNDIAVLQSSFEGTPTQKNALARLYASRDAILDPILADEQVLNEVVKLLGGYPEYEPPISDAAYEARDSVLARDSALGERINLLPPSQRTGRARSSYDDLASDRAALLNAAQAEGIASKLAPYGQRLTNISQLADRASLLPRPRTGIDQVRAEIAGRNFKSGPSGNNSPNVFTITRPETLYAELYCRVVDREKVLTFTLPLITSDASKHEIGHGMATLSYTEDVFATNATPQSATSGTFWVQEVEKEIYGIFSCEGPGFQIRDGRFRIKTKRDTL